MRGRQERGRGGCWAMPSTSALPSTRRSSWMSTQRTQTCRSISSRRWHAGGAKRSWRMRRRWIPPLSARRRRTTCTASRMNSRLRSSRMMANQTLGAGGQPASRRCRSPSPSSSKISRRLRPQRRSSWRRVPCRPTSRTLTPMTTCRSPSRTSQRTRAATTLCGSLGRTSGGGQRLPRTTTAGRRTTKWLPSLSGMSVLGGRVAGDRRAQLCSVAALSAGF
mmetsp:Transcript_1089/g.3262  ORF Transcript_1089/g.3262 Transcript_1089/m.3262 type:complete len:221 (-) Transcript_1089:69-731(-)